MKSSLPPLLQKIIDELADFSEVEGIALGGSRARGSADGKSDFDLYIYVSQIPEQERRQKVLEPAGARAEVGNSHWEIEDDVILHDGTPVEMVYRQVDEFEREVASLIEDVPPKTAY